MTDIAVCGTDAAYQRHRRRGEAPCGACRLAHAEYQRRTPWKQPENRARCSIDDCGKPVVARGWCAMHWDRWKHYGDPRFVQRLFGDARARFMGYVDKTGPVSDHRPDLGPCWLWTGNISPDGYGRFSLDGVSQAAHRCGYKLLVGDIPAGFVVDHLCRVRACVNLDHIELVTERENQRRGLRGDLLTHCHRGHLFDDENTYIYKGRRHCRACQRLRRVEAGGRS